MRERKGQEKELEMGASERVREEDKRKSERGGQEKE